MIKLYIKLFIILFVISNLNASERRGVYIWPITFYETGGIEKVFDVLIENQITDIFLLVKGEAGFSLFPSDYTIKDHYEKLLKESDCSDEKEKIRKIINYFSDESLLEKIIENSHRHGMKIHAWFIISGDRNFVENNPGSEVVRIPNPETNKYQFPLIDRGHVNLAYPPYKKYIFSQMLKSLEYPFDGLMLDKIRYTNLVYTYGDFHLSKALRSGINIDKVIDNAIETVYDDSNENSMFIKYRDGDWDVNEWIKIKKNDIEEYVKECRKITNERNIELSVSFMPEGAYDLEFADVHYAQNYKELSYHLDFIVIMAYPQNFSQPESWIKMVTASAKSISSCEVWIAIQGFDDVEDGSVFKQVKNSRITDADGIVVFRFGGMTQSMWSEFREGLTTSIKEEKESQIRGIIYNGSGTSRKSWAKITDALLKSNDIIPILLNQDNIKNALKSPDMDFIIIPGGSGTEIAVALKENILNNITEFVANGGGYIGICAGAYLPIKGYNDFTSQIEIVNAEAIDVINWDRGRGTAKLSIDKNHPVFTGIKNTEIEFEYINGPVFKHADLGFPSYKELATFKTNFDRNGTVTSSMIDRTAILETKFNSGTILLFSPHPELTTGKEFIIINSVDHVTRSKKNKY